MIKLYIYWYRHRTISSKNIEQICEVSFNIHSGFIKQNVEVLYSYQRIYWFIVILGELFKLILRNVNFMWGINLKSLTRFYTEYRGKFLVQG